MTPDLNGLYQCEASNTYGTKHGHLYVHVTSGEVRFDLAVGFLLNVLVFFAFVPAFESALNLCLLI